MAARNNAQTLTLRSDPEIVTPRVFDASRRRLFDPSTGSDHLRRRCGARAECCNDNLNKPATSARASAGRRSDSISIALGLLNGCVIAIVWAAIWFLF